MGFEPSKPGAARRSQGMALVSVLLVTVVLLAMAGAFFVAHRADLALLGSSTYREQTKNACLSVADFIQFKLQNDRRFGSKAFSRDGKYPKDEVFPPSGPDALLEIRYRGKGATSAYNKILGRMPTTEVDFEVTLVNNLTPSSVPQETLKYDRKAPPHTVRAWITARRGNITSKIDVIFKQSPFTNASITSGEDITVDLANANDGYWLLGAMQPSGNAVRAKGTITGPEVWSATGKAVQFLPPPGMERKLKPPYGVLQSQILNMQVDGIHRQLRAGTEMLEESEANIGGVLSPGGGAVKVPDLARSDLQGAARKVRFPHSELVFRTSNSDSGPVHRLENGNGQTLAEFKPNEQPSEFRRYSIDDDYGHRIATFDLENRVMTVAQNTELQVNGNFTLRAKAANSDGLTRQPTLFLGNSEHGASIDAASITVEGSVGGFGALKSSQGDIEIAAKSALSTTPDFGIALHSEDDVVLTRPGENSNDGLAVDWDAFALGSAKAGTSLNGWAYLPEDSPPGATGTALSKQTVAASFKEQVLAQPGGQIAFQELWDGLTADFPADERALAARDAWLLKGSDAVTIDDPDWKLSELTPKPKQIVVSEAVPPGPGISLGKYVRLREYLRTVKAGSPDPSWLDLETPDVATQRDLDVVNLVKNQLSSYQLSAGQVTTEINGQPILAWKPLRSYFKGSNPYTATFAPDMLFRGLVYAKGDFIFDTERKGVYIEGALVAKGNIKIQNATGAHFVYNSDLLQNLFATDELDLSIPLKKAYWAYY